MFGECLGNVWDSGISVSEMMRTAKTTKFLSQRTIQRQQNERSKRDEEEVTKKEYLDQIRRKRAKALCKNSELR